MNRQLVALFLFFSVAFPYSALASLDQGGGGETISIIKPEGAFSDDFISNGPLFVSPWPATKKNNNDNKEDNNNNKKERFEPQKESKEAKKEHPYLEEVKGYCRKQKDSKDYTSALKVVEKIYMDRRGLGLTDGEKKGFFNMMKRNKLAPIDMLPFAFFIHNPDCKYLQDFAKCFKHDDNISQKRKCFLEFRDRLDKIFTKISEFQSRYQFHPNPTKVFFPVNRTLYLDQFTGSQDLPLFVYTDFRMAKCIAPVGMIFEINLNPVIPTEAIKGYLRQYCCAQDDKFLAWVPLVGRYYGSSKIVDLTNTLHYKREGKEYMIYKCPIIIENIILPSDYRNFYSCFCQKSKTPSERLLESAFISLYRKRAHKIYWLNALFSALRPKIAGGGKINFGQVNKGDLVDPEQLFIFFSNLAKSMNDNDDEFNQYIIESLRYFFKGVDEVVVPSSWGEVS